MFLRTTEARQIGLTETIIRPRETKIPTREALEIEPKITAPAQVTMEQGARYTRVQEVGCFTTTTQERKSTFRSDE